jgi:hypothetical protein
VRRAARSARGQRASPAALIALLAFCPAAQGGDATGCIAGREVEPVRILFIGNSYSFYNDLPDLLASQAAANGIQAQVRITARNGASLEDHWRDGEAVSLLRAQRWDFVVLQERSSIARDQTDHAASFAARFDREIRKAGGRTLFYATPSRKGDVAKQEAIDRGYRRIAASLDAVVVPVGAAFQRAYAAMPDATLHAPDGIHPGRLGTWLAAYVFYVTLFGDLPERTECGDRWSCPPDEMDRLFRRAAVEAVREFTPGEAR